MKDIHMPDFVSWYNWYRLIDFIGDPFYYNGLTLTHWGRVTHICVSKRTIIGSDNGLSPSRRQAIIWTNAGILLIGPSGTNFSEILIEIITFSLKKMRLKVSSAKWRPCCLGLNVLTPACISNEIHYNVWDEITYPFPNFNVCTVEVLGMESLSHSLLGMWLLIHVGI